MLRCRFLFVLCETLLRHRRSNVLSAVRHSSVICFVYFCHLWSISLTAVKYIFAICEVYFAIHEAVFYTAKTAFRNTLWRVAYCLTFCFTQICRASQLQILKVCTILSKPYTMYDSMGCKVWIIEKSYYDMAKKYKENFRKTRKFAHSISCYILDG